jgi:hypothetical protein
VRYLMAKRDRLGHQIDDLPGRAEDLPLPGPPPVPHRDLPRPDGDHPAPDGDRGTAAWPAPAATR